jgi:hypothetical protein
MKYFQILVMIIAVVVFFLTVQRLNFSDLSFKTNYRDYLRIVLSIGVFLIYWGKVFKKKSI